jgi:GAF domain-containing protein
LAILDDDSSRAFGGDDERMLRSLCSQAAFSLVKAQQLTRLVEDVSRHEAVKHDSIASDVLGCTCAMKKHERFAWDWDCYLMMRLVMAE